jgi:hypothetical protein
MAGSSNDEPWKQLIRLTNDSSNWCITGSVVTCMGICMVNFMVTLIAAAVESVDSLS